MKPVNTRITFKLSPHSGLYMKTLLPQIRHVGIPTVDFAGIAQSVGESGKNPGEIG